MSEGTKIQWADDTWNPWQGCTKVSPGCKNCYAEARDKRFAGEEGILHWGKGAPRVRSSAATFNAPLRWSKHPVVCDCGTVAYAIDDDFTGPCPKCEGGVHRRRVFSLSLGDWLDDEVPIEWMADMLDVIRRCPNLDFLLLTKRPENWEQRMASVLALHLKDDLAYWIHAWFIDDFPRKNIWLGASIENQAADNRIRKLLKIPAKVRFLSVEPLLEAIEFTKYLPCYKELGRCKHDRLNWVIVGGESGPNARPCDVGWIRGIVSQCKAQRLPVFVKQLGSRPYQSPEHDNATGFELNLTDRKGGDPSEWPEDLRVREFPKETAT